MRRGVADRGQGGGLEVVELGGGGVRGGRGEYEGEGETVSDGSAD